MSCKTTKQLYSQKKSLKSEKIWYFRFDFELNNKKLNKVVIENLIIASTLKSQEVKFNINGELLIAGKSIPEDLIPYYKPLFYG
jgi:hypothetical protein